MTTATHGIPEAWPQLLSREQLCAYLGGLSWDTVKKILPVAPLDLGANVLRYRKPDIDVWVQHLPLKSLTSLQPSATSGQDAPEATPEHGLDHRSAALERVRRRAGKGQSGCRTSR